MIGRLFVVILTCALAAGLALPPPPSAVTYFPGDYYATKGRFAVERQVLETWPGPTAMSRLLALQGLTEDQKVALLLGAGAFHDPQLLPAYRAALGDPSPKVRKAAVFGYRVLLGDVPPVEPDVRPEAVLRVRKEMRIVGWALRRESLVRVWLDSLLAPDGVSLSAHKGLVFERPEKACALALDRLVEPEDISLVAEAYRRAEGRSRRVLLLRFLESLGMRKMIKKPKGVRVGWGDEIYVQALERGDALVARLCNTDVHRFLRSRLATAGARGVDPESPEAAFVWIAVLDKMPESWWGVANRMLARSGAPWEFISLYEPESKSSKAARDRLLQFYGVRGGRAKQAATR